MQDRPLPLIPTLYSFTALTLVYYASYYASRSFFMSVAANGNSTRSMMLQYIFSWRVIWLLGISAAYFAIIYFADNYFIGADNLGVSGKRVLLYLDSKFGRASFYLAVAIFAAADDCLIAKKDKIIEGESNVSLVLMREMDERNEQYDKRLKEMEAQIARLEMNSRKNM